MKKLFVLLSLIICFLHTSAQDSNVLISLAAPVFGIKVKANFPGSTGNWARGYYFVNESNTENFFGFGAYGSTTNGIASFDHGWIGQDYSNPYMNFLSNGNVGIGTMSPAEKLAVNGNIRAKEIKVEVANWPDYVFSPGYSKMSLYQTEEYIKENRHLPGIPSVSQVLQDGVNVGEMQAKLLQKIEELTLIIIEQQKILDRQSKQLEKLVP